MQFEIPMEMLGQMMGGGGMMRQQRETEWPSHVDSSIASEYEWLENTEWQGKNFKFMLHAGGAVESDLKECKQVWFHVGAVARECPIVVGVTGRLV